MNIQANNLQAEALDHHGLVAAVCQDLNIAERINACIEKKDPRRIVSPGIACVAMILNGLGFTNRRLYLTHQFFQNKPIARLLGQNLEAKHFHDDTLGDALDAIADYGATQLEKT